MAPRKGCQRCSGASSTKKRSGDTIENDKSD